MLSIASMRTFGALALALISLAGCGAAPDSDADTNDDAPGGDSVPLGKIDGYSVPPGLGLNKNKVLYLTFDDGPHTTNTPKVLDILKQHGAHATFFITGINIAGRESLIRREVAEGHIVGNHQWEHVVATMAQFADFVSKEQTLLASLTGPGNPLYFRYPYGSMAPWKETILKQDGYLNGGIGWDIDSLDWDFGNDETASANYGVPVSFR